MSHKMSTNIRLRNSAVSQRYLPENKLAICIFITCGLIEVWTFDNFLFFSILSLIMCALILWIFYLVLQRLLPEQEKAIRILIALFFFIRIALLNNGFIQIVIGFKMCATVLRCGNQKRLLVEAPQAVRISSTLIFCWISWASGDLDFVAVESI